MYSLDNAEKNTEEAANVLPKGSTSNEPLPKYKRDIVAKIRCLRTEIVTLQPQSGHCRLEVSRNEIFEVS